MVCWQVAGAALLAVGACSRLLAVQAGTASRSSAGPADAKPDESKRPSHVPAGHTLHSETRAQCPPTTTLHRGHVVLRLPTSRACEGFPEAALCHQPCSAISSMFGSHRGKNDGLVSAVMGPRGHQPQHTARCCRNHPERHCTSS